MPNGHEDCPVTRREHDQHRTAIHGRVNRIEKRLDSLILMMLGSLATNIGAVVMIAMRGA